MTDMDWGNLIYLVLLGSALVTWYFVHNRQSLGKMMQQAVAWGLIFIAVIAAVGLWEDIRGTVQPGTAMSVQGDRIEVPRARDGHFYLTLDINDVPVRFLVDTGASEMVLRQRDAERAGVDMGRLIYSGRAMTANGPVRTAPVWLKQVSLGQSTDTDVRAWVNEGEMSESLLGMGYLQRFARLEITPQGLVLER